MFIPLTWLTQNIFQNFYELFRIIYALSKPIMTFQRVIHYQQLNTASKIIPLNQHKLQILNQNRVARCNRGGESAHEQQSKSIPPSFDSSKHGLHAECYKRFTVGLNITTRKSEVEGA